MRRRNLSGQFSSSPLWNILVTKHKGGLNLSECSLENKECKCNCGKLTDWLVVYELALIIIILLFIYTEIEKPKAEKEENNEQND
jgi:hypothetical protein